VYRANKKNKRGLIRMTAFYCRERKYNANVAIKWRECSIEAGPLERVEYQYARKVNVWY